MAIEDKIIQAQPLARRIKQIRGFNFEVKTANGFFLTLADFRLVEFDTLTEANTWKDNFNSSFAVTKSNLLVHLGNKLDTTINA